MMRIYPTWLEHYRKWQSTEGMPEQNLIDSVKGVKTESNFMMYGSAFHKILEEPTKYRREGMQPLRARRGKPMREASTVYTCNGTVFDSSDVERALQYVDLSALNEVRSYKKFRISTGDDIAVVGRVDQLRGLSVVEYKTKWGEFDIQSYLDSLQWRVYTQIFDVKCVTYKIFCMKERDSLSEFANHPALDLIDIHVFELFAYDGIYDDCLAAIEEFVEWVRFRGLDQYLITKKQGAEDVF